MFNDSLQKTIEEIYKMKNQLISDYGVEFGAFPDSRSGLAKMATEVAPYKVNSQYSGTADNNFITRAIRRVRPELDRIFKGALR